MWDGGVPDGGFTCFPQHWPLCVTLKWFQERPDCLPRWPGTILRFPGPVLGSQGSWEVRVDSRSAGFVEIGVGSVPSAHFLVRVPVCHHCHLGVSDMTEAGGGPGARSPAATVVLVFVLWRSLLLREKPLQPRGLGWRCGLPLTRLPRALSEGSGTCSRFSRSHAWHLCLCGSLP